MVRPMMMIFLHLHAVGASRHRLQSCRLYAGCQISSDTKCCTFFYVVLRSPVKCMLPLARQLTRQQTAPIASLIHCQARSSPCSLLGMETIATW